MHEQESHGLSDNVAAAQNDGVCAFDLDFVAAENFHASRGGARNEARAPADEFSQADGVKAIDVLGGIDRFKNALGVHLRWKRELHKNAVNVIVAVEILDDGKKVEGADGSRWRQEGAGEANLFASSDLAFDVELRSRIFPDKHRREAGTDACGSEKADFIFQFGEDLVADFCAIEDACGHAVLAFDLRVRDKTK